MHHHYVLARIAQDRIDELVQGAAARNQRAASLRDERGSRSRRRRRWPW